MKTAMKGGTYMLKKRICALLAVLLLSSIVLSVPGVSAEELPFIDVK